jgi:16S rRNA (uracil1498-N3)-methyltransferase
MPLFFIEPGVVDDDQVTISGPLGHHLVESLRLRDGEEIWLAEPAGPRYQARVLGTKRGTLTAQILSVSSPPLPASPRITTAIALIKSDHMAWAIQKATELGVAEIVPLITRRTIVRPEENRSASRTGRWQSIAREAAQQSMRWDIPTVTQPVPFDHWCETTKVRPSCRLLLWEKPGGCLLRDKLRQMAKPDSITLAVGPEGGFETDELEKASENGFEPVSLGSRIVRTETAVLAALAILQYEWGN